MTRFDMIVTLSVVKSSLKLQLKSVTVIRSRSACNVTAQCVNAINWKFYRILNVIGFFFVEKTTLELAGSGI